MRRRIRTKAPLRGSGGFTLVEVLVALAISLVLMAGTIQLLLASKATYRMEEELARLQENGRFVVEWLARELRTAGDLGCANQTAPLLNVLNYRDDFEWRFRWGVEGFEATGAGWMPALAADITAPRTGSDVIAVRGGISEGVLILEHPEDEPPGAAPLRVDDASGLKPCDVVLATDCVGAAIFQMTALGGQGSCQTAANGQQRLQAGQISHEAGVGRPGNASINLGRSYVGGELLPLATRTYYVRVNTAGRPGLWQRVADQNAQELVEGVEELQVVYGMDRDGDGQADEYRRADAVAATGAWGLVVSVRLGLLLVGDAPVLSPDARIYEVNGESVTTSDRRLRQVFTTTVALRNRLP